MIENKPRINVFDDEHFKEYKPVIEKYWKEHLHLDVQVDGGNSLPNEKDLLDASTQFVTYPSIVDLNFGKGYKEGVDYIKRVKELNPWSIIVVISGNLNNDDRVEECRKAGASLILSRHNILEKLAQACELIFQYYTVWLANPIKEVSYNAEVIDKTESEVLLSVAEQSSTCSDENEKELWFDINRVGKPDHIQLGGTFIMRDRIMNYGHSWLWFEQTDQNVFNRALSSNMLPKKAETFIAKGFFDER